MKNKKRINLQLLSEGGAGASAAGAGDSGAATGVEGGSPVPQDEGGDLSNVVYGKSEQALTQPNVTTASNNTVEDRQKAFDEMVKKGGEYSEQFNKRTQDIINKRFKETKGLEEKIHSYDPIMQTLSAKYGVDASDIEGIAKALESDNSMFEEQAYKEGLTPEQYRQKLALERENAELKKAEEDRRSLEASNKIYAGWVEDAQALSQKYGREIDLSIECQNPDFTKLLGDGVSLEAAYNAIHYEEMLNGAMAATATHVEQALVNSISSRAGRPVENGAQSSNTQVFKSDVNNFTDEDMKEIARRVEAGEKIYL